MKVATLSLLGIFALVKIGSAGEVDGTQELNRLLANKPAVQYAFCRAPSNPGLCTLASIGAGAPSGPPSTGPALVTSSSVVRVDSIRFDRPHLAALPEVGLLSHRLLLNCGTDNLTESVSLSVTGTRSWRVSKTDGVSTTNGASVTGSFGIEHVGTLGTNMSWSQTISTSTTKEESSQESITRSVTDTITIGPKKPVSVYLLAFQEALEVPFSATVVVDGTLFPNVAGLTNASSLLSLAERTFKIKGTLQIADVSEGSLRTDDVQGSAGCSDNNRSTEGAEILQQSFPSAHIAHFLTSGFVPQHSQAQGSILSHALRQFGTLTADEGTALTPADGTQYEVLYTTEIAKPAAGQCGFNDLGLPNAGIFTVEARQYRTYTNGRLVSEWQQDIETFKSCYTP